jgi:hypothetical protein
MRLQVLLPDEEMADIQRLAQRDGVSVGKWVRRALDEARTRRPVNEPDAKLKAVRQSTTYSFPTSDMDQMLSEIEQGYDRSLSAHA